METREPTVMVGQWKLNPFIKRRLADWIPQPQDPLMVGTLTLVFETSTPHASIALCGPDGVLAQHTFSSDRNHNALLFDPLSDLLTEEVRKQIGIILVGTGPGSYSGTRVGIAAAQGVAIALGCPAIGVPSILAVPSAANGAACIAIGDARRGSFWTSTIENSRLLEEPTLCDAGNLGETIANAKAAGIPVISFEDAQRFPVADDLKAWIRIETPDATRLWHAWKKTDRANQESWARNIPQPIYLKPPHITPGKRPSLLRPQ